MLLLCLRAVVYTCSAKKVIWKTCQSTQEKNGEKTFFLRSSLQTYRGKDFRTYEKVDYDTAMEGGESKLEVSILQNFPFLKNE